MTGWWRSYLSTTNPIFQFSAFIKPISFCTSSLQHSTLLISVIPLVIFFIRSYSWIFEIVSLYPFQYTLYPWLFTVVWVKNVTIQAIFSYIIWDKRVKIAKLTTGCTAIESIFFQTTWIITILVEYRNFVSYKMPGIIFVLLTLLRPFLLPLSAIRVFSR